MPQVAIQADLEEGEGSVGKTMKLLWAMLMAASSDSDSTKKGGLPESVGQAQWDLLSPRCLGLSGGCIHTWKRGLGRGGEPTEGQHQAEGSYLCLSCHRY